MKKLLTIVFAILLAGSLSFAQATSPTSGDAQKPTTPAPDTGKKTTKTKAHKGKKSKKSSSAAPAATAPTK